jgi:hypothetical protein
MALFILWGSFHKKLEQIVQSFYASVYVTRQIKSYQLVLLHWIGPLLFPKSCRWRYQPQKFLTVSPFKFMSSSLGATKQQCHCQYMEIGCMYLGMKTSLEIRVTRFGDFSPIMWLFTWGYWKLQNCPKFWTTFFHMYIFWNNIMA